MSSSLDRWNLRHQESVAHSPPPPSASLIQAFPLLAQAQIGEGPRPSPSAIALDLACGAGQNAVWLAVHGWPTVAVDFSSAALERAAALARSQSIRTARADFVRLPHRFEGLLLVEADLESSPLPEAAFTLLICFHYLDRSAFPRIERAIAPGGFLLYETFTEGQRAFAEGPHSPEHLLRAGELRHAFPGLDTLFYREWTTGLPDEAHRGRAQAGRALASLVARKPGA